MMPKQRFTAGQTVRIKVEMDFSNPKTPKDWSLTAYGNKGNVAVVHTGGS